MKKDTGKVEFVGQRKELFNVWKRLSYSIKAM